MELVQDFRQGVRLLAKNPRSTLAALTLLALPIGANTALFSVINSVLLRPLPYPASERIVRVGEIGRGGGLGELSNRSLPLWRTAESFELVAGYAPRSYTWLGPDGPEKLNGAAVSPAMFPLLRTAPHLGRLFTNGEEAPGADRVALLSYQSWVNRFAEDPDVVGSPVSLDGEPHIIIGVLTEGFYFPDRQVELWTPLVLPPVDSGSFRISIGFSALARLRDGVTIEQARAEGETIVRRLDADQPQRASGAPSAPRAAQIVLLHEEMVRDLRPALLVFSAAIVGMLLIAITSLAGLLLARGAVRQHELAVRGALGAGRGRLVRQLLTESVTLSVCGGAIGLLAMFWILSILPTVAPRGVPRLDEARVDTTILVFNLGLSIVVGIVFGSVPALQWSRLNLVRTLNLGSVQSAGGLRLLRPNKARAGLVVLQVALALVLLIGAGLLLRSFVALVRIDPGYDPTNVITAQVDIPGSLRGLDLARITPEMLESQVSATPRFAEQLLAPMDTLPGVRAAGLSSSLPLVPGSVQTLLWRDGRPEPPEPTERFRVTVHVVSPGYLDAMGLQVVSGRFLTERDTQDSPNVGVVNEALAGEAVLGAEAVGQRLRFSGGVCEVVGTIRNVKYTGLDAAESEPEIYIPYQQLADWDVFVTSFKLAVRTDVDSVAFVPFLRDAVASVDLNTPLYDVMTMDARLSASVAQPRFYALCVGLLAAVALMMAAVGLYGVVAYTVSERSREIGVRVALGAQRGDILSLVLRRGTTLVAIGIAFGLLAAAGSTHILARLLFGVTTGDLPTFLAVPVLLITVSLFACYLPARRATRVDPMEALRYE